MDTNLTPAIDIGISSTVKTDMDDARFKYANDL